MMWRGWIRRISSNSSLFPKKYSPGGHNKIWPHSMHTPLFSSEKAKTEFDFLSAKNGI